MNNLHPGRMYTPPCGGVQGGLPPLRGPRGLSPSCGVQGKIGPQWGFKKQGSPMVVSGQSPQRKTFLVNAYCNFIVNLDHKL
jgi:hypothetical protein